MNARRGSRELLAAALVALVLLAVLAATLLSRSERSAYSNTRVLFSDNATVVNPGAEHCDEVFVPSDAETLQIFAGTRGRLGPPIEVRVLDADGRQVRGAAQRGGYGDNQTLRLRLSPGPTLDPGRVCIRNLGEHLVQFANAQQLSSGLSVQERTAEVRLEFFLEGRPRNIELAPKAARRAALLKSSLIGEWAIWLIPVVFIGIMALSVRLLLREAGR